MSPVKFCHFIDASTRNPLLFESVKFSDRGEFEYSVISMRPEGELHEQMKGLGVRASSIECGSRKQYPKAIVKLAAMFRREKFDVVQVHSFEASLVGLIAAFIAGVPVRVFSGHHSHEVPLYNNRRLLWVDSFLAGRLATHVVAPSRNMRDIFVTAHRLSSSRVTVIHHGLDLTAWDEAASSGQGIRDELMAKEKKIFLAVGRLFWVKGFDTLIRAFAAVAASRDDVLLVIAGEGANREELESLIRSLGVGDSIKLIGKRRDIAAVMKDVDVLVHPSLAESFGLIYTEAFALGKPVIATRCGIAEEMVSDGECGYLIEPGNEDELAEALYMMVEREKDWTEMGKMGKQAAKRFSVQHTQAECDRFMLSLVQ